MTVQTRHRIAWILAVVVDALQIGTFGFQPFSQILSNVVDVIVMVVFWRLLGWHWAFLPSFVMEMLPFFDLVPSWTLAVAIATRKGAAPPPRPEVDVTPPTLTGGVSTPQQEEHSSSIPRQTKG